MTDEERQKKLELLKNQCKVLAASFDAVQIYASKDDGDATHSWSWGFGNYNARYGHVRRWLVNQDGEEMDDGARRNDE